MNMFEFSSIWQSGHARRIVRPAVAWNHGIVITDVALPPGSTFKHVALCSVAGAGWIWILVHER